ncbi:ABC transporter permease [Actinoplanes lobatus]|uniref:ABC transporter permease n=1 Tax=Actinoplanes lobatus TaxID=113568 RepID=A0A7W7MHK5_9ACTN|nr:polyketide antibiotic transporter [Actinoplanes lobatus]MBB4750045.1 ABC-2 type transport system permease protein [Actinoplanes lobatus]GGN74930.1 ABC transporter permease [Actinoplanes lobatus]GIE39068.1 ABC transporter permease [Actinoplanes lobatus]
MSTDILPAPGRAVTRLAIRQVRRSGSIVVVLITGMTALVTSTYAQVMADPAAAGSLEALAGNPAIRTLFGEPVGLDTAGGFTVWRVGTVTAVLLGAWAIMATTRITRGEEDSGRWDILLAGRVALREVVLRHLAAVMIVPAVTGCLLAAVLIAAGTPVSGAVLHGAGTGLLGMVFVAVAALAAQIFPARAAATGTAVAVLGVTLLLRMIGDGVTALGWLRWLSPSGLLGLSGPYVHNRTLPLLIMLVVAAAITVAALAAAGRREIRGGLVPAVAGRRPRLGLLGSAEAFAVRRVLRPLTGWAIGIGAYYLLIGLTAVSVTGFLTDNPAMADQAAAAGFDALGDVAGFAAVLFAILGLPVGGFTAVRMSAFVAAEADRRLTLLAAQPIRRTRLLGAELTATAGAATVLVTLAGLTTWLGVTIIGGDFELAAAMRGVWNTLPVVWLSLGAAVFATGWAPRWVGVIGALPATGGFLLLVIAESIAAPNWVRNLSPFTHLAPVPLTPVDWTASATMTGLAAILTVAGGVGYRRRDLRS